MRKEKVRVGKRKIDKDLHDLLMRHYDLDDEKGICRLRFEYERFDDFFETRYGKGAILKGALKDTLENLLVTIPNCYDFEFTIAIKDYQRHSKEEGMRALKDGLLLNGYTYRRAMTVKKWIAHSEGFAKGRININEGAMKALAGNRASSLLPVGVVSIEGEFEKGDIVRIISPDGRQIGIGKVSMDSAGAIEAIGQKGAKPLVHYDYLYME